MTSGCLIFATEYAFCNHGELALCAERVHTYDFLWGENTKLDLLDLADGQRGHLNLCCEVDNFLEPRYAKGDVLAQNTSMVERVQSYLRGGFIDRLGSESPTCIVGS